MEFLIRYLCPACQHQWHEVWSCACDSECPECGCGDIQTSDYEVIASDTEESND